MRMSYHQLIMMSHHQSHPSYARIADTKRNSIHIKFITQTWLSTIISLHNKESKHKVKYITQLKEKRTERHDMEISEIKKVTHNKFIIKGQKLQSNNETSHAQRR